MIDRIYLSLALLGAVIILICHGAELNSDESEARKFLNQTSDKLFEIRDQKANASKTRFYTIQLRNALNEADAIRKIAKSARKFDFENFKDEDLKYAFKTLLQGADLMVIKQKKFSELFDGLDDLEVENHFFDDFHDPEDNVLSYTDVIEGIVKKSRDLKELQHYWSELRKITEEWAMHNVDTILKALQDAAKVNNVSPLEFWSRGYSIADMEALMADIKPLYLELHAFIRNLLRKKYGESVMAADGLIPDHLFEQVLIQAPTNESIIDEIFPYTSLPPVETEMAEKFKAKQLYQIAEGFYGNLGFEKYPESVWGDRIKSSHEEDEKSGDDHEKSESDGDSEDDSDEDESDEEYDDEDCHLNLSYSTPKILLEFCEKLKVKDFLNAYAVMGYLHYAKEMVGLPAYFFKPPQNLDRAIGKAVTLSASTHQNLQEIGMLNDFKITPEVELNRLLRMAIVGLINIPSDFVHAKVMSDLVSGSVKKSEISKHYWDLMDKYVGVGPPKGHKISKFDLPLSFYDKMTQNYMSRDFTTDILGYQIHKKLCELSGKYPKDQLHLCDINGNKEAGNALKKMMQLGSSKPFNEVLATMFPDSPTVKVEGLLEYYSPIKKLLEDKNKEEKVLSGWKNSNSS